MDNDGWIYLSIMALAAIAVATNAWIEVEKIDALKKCASALVIEDVFHDD